MGWDGVEAVWVLAGSAGATTAVQAFLNTFAVPPPVGFIYAQHFAPQEQHQLLHFTAENPDFSIDIGVGEHRPTQGRVLMVPPQSKIAIDDTGNISSTGVGWEHHYTPNIDELLALLIAASPPLFGAIIFSGMGRDGIAALPLLHRAGTNIWAQSPGSAVCDSMPKAAIETGLVNHVGDPVQLARDLEKLYQ